MQNQSVNPYFLRINLFYKAEFNLMIVVSIDMIGASLICFVLFFLEGVGGALTAAAWYL